MTTATTIEEQIEKAERAAEAAKAKASELRAVHDAEREKEAQRRQRATDAFYQERAGELGNVTARIDAAWATFVDAVKSSGDVIGAYLNWRRTQAAGWREIDDIVGYLHKSARARYEARSAEWHELNRTVTALDGAEGIPGFHDYAGRLADYNRRRAAFEGIELADDAPLARPLPLPDVAPESSFLETRGREALALNLSDAISAALAPVLKADSAEYGKAYKQQLAEYVEKFDT
jgi:hypothetical protein